MTEEAGLSDPTTKQNAKRKQTSVSVHQNGPKARFPSMSHLQVLLFFFLNNRLYNNSRKQLQNAFFHDNQETHMPMVFLWLLVRKINLL